MDKKWISSTCYILQNFPHWYWLSLAKIHYVEFGDITLQTTHITVQNAFGIEKILKIDIAA